VAETADPRSHFAAYSVHSSYRMSNLRSTAKMFNKMVVETREKKDQYELELLYE
jgi:uncharacterized membrane protein (DUF106 family)